MLENRPIVVIMIGYIIGIIVGLYCKISIVLLYALGFIVYLIIKRPNKNEFKMLSFKRYFRYIKLIFIKKVCVIIFIISIISNFYILNQNSQYNLIYYKFNNKEIQIRGKIISNVRIERYKKIYKVKVIKVLNKEIQQKTCIEGKNIIISTNKFQNTLEFEDELVLIGTFKKPKSRTNYKGFDYQEYLKTQKICGTIDVNSISNIKKNENILKSINKIFLNCKKIVQYNFECDVSNFLIGITLGDTSEIDKNVKENFSKNNISHLLAISGMHISYIIIICSTLKKIIGVKFTYIISIILLIIYMFLIGFHTSAIRATIMAILFLISKLIHKKSDTWTNISLALLVLLIYNPFLIKETGLILSFLGTIGIILYSKIFKVKNKILNMICLSCSVLLIIIPFLAIIFNQIPLVSIFTSCFIGILVMPIFVLSLFFLMLNKLEFYPKFLISILTKTLLKLSEIGATIPFAKIYVITPNVINIVMYYILIFLSLFLYLIYHKKNKNAFNRRIVNLISLFKYKLRHNKNKVISVILIITIFFSIIKIIPKNLKMYFIDVGQGDSCLIITPHNKRILIDGGGNETYDVGKNTLIPYLLNRKVKKVDYIIISHFDTDHVDGLLTVMEELKVDTVVISKQGETGENYKRFIKIIKEKHIKILVIGQGDRLKIENDLYFDILWPNKSKLINENILNNNSIVCKMYYKNFSMLFTGDIEEVAEREILQEYTKNLQVLNSTILKVAHHGSKTSSIHEFLQAVKPKFALIGVGQNNTFGHPNENVLKSLIDLRCKSIQN